MNRALALPLVLAAPLTAQETWVVDDDGPADFTSVQAAVDAAADGDVIVVRPGGYIRAAIDGKGLTIQADGDVQLMVALAQIPTLEVRNLAADQAVYVRGLRLRAMTSEVATVRLENCAGPVLLEECDISGAGTPVVVGNCASTTISRSELVAPLTFASIAPFFFLGFVTYPGLIAVDSNVFLYDSLVVGSSGGDSDFLFVSIPPGTSAPGVLLQGSTFLASGCTLRGGDGGSGSVGDCYTGADGSPGLVVEGGFVHPTGTARLLDCTVSGGAGGLGNCGLPAGADGVPIEVKAGQVIDLPGSARKFSGSSPAVDGTATMVHLEGQPGDLVLLFVHLEAAPGLFIEPFAAALHLPLPAATFGLGSLPPSGALDLAFPVPSFPPGVESFRAIGQALFVAADGFFEGGPSTLLIVDAGL